MIKQIRKQVEAKVSSIKQLEKKVKKTTASLNKEKEMKNSSAKT